MVAEVDFETFLTFPKPCLALVDVNGNQQIVIAELNNKKDKVTITSDQNKVETQPIDEFFGNWKRIVIIADENKDAKKGISQRFEKYQSQLLIGSLVFGLVFYIFMATHSVPYTLGFLGSIIGVFVSILILRKDYNINTGFTDKFCTALPNSNCENVMKSKGAKFFGVSLSDISFIYFVSILVIQLILPHSFILPIISLVTVPMIIFSIYYQWQIVKTWCPLCLMIVLCLGCWATMGTIIILTQKLKADGITIFISFVVFALATVVFFSLKPNLKIIGVFNDIKKELLSFKRNYHLFMPFYVNNARQIEKQEFANEIILGNRQNPLITLTAITNPLCESCIETHKVYEELVNKYPQIQLKLRFLVPFNDRKDPRTFITEQMLNINQSQPNDIEACLSDWYENPNIKTWIDQWDINKDFIHNKTLMLHNHWCIYNELDYTPALVINNKVFPRIYDPKDVQYFIEYFLKYEEYTKQQDSQLQRL